MSGTALDRFVRLPKDVQADLVLAARDNSPVSGLTHGFYKYPARFSPAFAKAAIQVFTNPGDLVLDPHVGGGTTLVEAIASGREGVGVDISTLAEFVTEIKCTIFSDPELKTLERWAKRLTTVVDLRKPTTPLFDYQELGYYKHLDHPSRWRLRKAIEQSLASAIKLGTPRTEAFGRCVVLRAAQRALDGRGRHTSIGDFRRMLHDSAIDMLAGARDLRSSVKANGQLPIRI